MPLEKAFCPDLDDSKALIFTVDANFFDLFFIEIPRVWTNLIYDAMLLCSICSGRNTMVYDVCACSAERQMRKDLNSSVYYLLFHVQLLLYITKQVNT